VGVCTNPMRTRKARRSASSIRPPTSAVKAEALSRSRGGTYWVAAFSVVKSTKRPESPAASVASVAMRVAETSGCGETRS